MDKNTPALPIQALHQMVEQGNLELVKEFFSQFPDAAIDAPDKDGWTPLMYAADEGHLEMVKLLLQRGVNVNGLSGFNETALMCAADRGHFEIAEMLLDAGADPTVFNDAEEDVFYLAADNGHTLICEMLETYGGNPEASTARRRVKWQRTVSPQQNRPE